MRLDAKINEGFVLITSARMDGLLRVLSNRIAGSSP
jgi:hypothetical protein